MPRRRLPVLGRWPVLRQIAAGDAAGLDGTARSPRTDALRPRTQTIAHMAKGELAGYLVLGENPVVGTVGGPMQREGASCGRRRR